MNTTVTFAGNLTEDPEVRFTHGGKPVAQFRVIVNRRTKNDAGEWSDAEPTGHSCKIYGPAAENVAESLTRGDRVVIHGEVRTETWNDKDTGEKRTKDVIIVEEIGASLKWASVRITKTSHTTPEED